MRLNQGPENTSIGRAGRAEWPDAVAYREAIQSPSLTLGDPLLTGARVAENRQGLPIAYTGRFAVVFRLRGQDGTDWALRCFTTPQDGYGITRGTRYRLLASQISSLEGIFVPFRLVESGIRVSGKWYPTIAMRWSTGTPLGRWIEDNREQPEKLRQLATTLGELLAKLEAAGMAHGDWQHDNLLISPDGKLVTLVDYDAMFVPGLEGYPSPELGHHNYQHPDRQAMHFGVGLDRFACLAIQTGLLTLAYDPSLWLKHGDGESVLFKAVDFRDPTNSTVFQSVRAIAELEHDDTLMDYITRLNDACLAGLDSALLPAISTEAPKPLPAEFLGPPEPSAEERAAKADDLDWIRTYSEVVTHGKWWQESGSYRLGPQRQMQQDSFRYLTQLNDALFLGKEKHLVNLVRIALAAVFVLVAALVPTFQGLLGYAPLFLILWILNALWIGYANWPRRKLLDELNAEIMRMGELIGERRDRIATRTRGSSPQGLALAQGTLQDYVTEKLRHVPINRVITIPGIPVPVKRDLQATGISNALELSRRTTLPGIPQHQINTLQNWCRDLEKEFEDEYRKTSAAAKNVTVDVQRLEMEVAEFERETEKLKREREQFPTTSLRAYLKAIFPFLS